MELYYHSPIGIIKLSGDDSGLRSCSFVAAGSKKSEEAGTEKKLKKAPRPIREAWKQLDEYFAGQRKSFSVKLNLQGTSFQKKVWEELQKIPYGQTRSYGEIARACGRPRASRAVGQANHKNPVVIIVPCHRVVGSDGRLVGFGGGLWRKKWLLQHEARHQ